MRKIINIAVLVCFCFNVSIDPGSNSFGQKISPLPGANLTEHNLSASSRFQPPVLIKWDKKSENYKFYDHTEAFQNAFKYKSQMAYITALFGQFLKDQKSLLSKELSMSEEGLRNRFELFRQLLIEKKNKDGSDLPDLNFDAPEGSNALRMENNGTIWVSCDGPVKNSLYFYCFYLSDREETGRAIFSLPVDDGQKVICERLGPFNGDFINDKYIGAGTKPSNLFDLLRHSIFEFGSEVSLEWGREINSRCIIDLFRYLNKDKKELTREVRKHYFKLLLVNIMVSSRKIDSPFVRELIAEFMVTEDKKKKMEIMAGFQVEWKKASSDTGRLEEGKVDKEELRVFTAVIEEIKKDFRDEVLSREWITEFHKDLMVLLTPADLVLDRNTENSISPGIGPGEENIIEDLSDRAIKAAEQISVKIRTIVDKASWFRIEDIEVLRSMEKSIEGLIASLYAGDRTEAANIIVDKYFKDLWTAERRVKVKNFMPGDKITVKAAMVKYKGGRIGELPELVESLFGSIRNILTESPKIDEQVIAIMYAIEGSLENIMSLLLDSEGIETADILTDKYFYELWTPEFRQRTKHFLPGHRISRLLAAIKFSKGDFGESCAILESALDAFNLNKKYFKKDPSMDFETNALLQLSEGYLRRGKVEAAEKTLNKLRETLEPVIDDKSTIMIKKYLQTKLGMMKDLRDIAVIKSNFPEAIRICNDMDTMITEGNLSMSEDDTRQLIIESIARIDLSLRLWEISDIQHKLKENIEAYRSRVLKTHPKAYQIKLYDGWMAFKEGRMDIVKDKVEELSSVNDLSGKEYVIFIQLCKVSALYFDNAGDRVSAERMADIGIDLTGYPPFTDSFNRAMFMSFQAVKKGYKEVREDAVNDIKAKKYEIKDMPEILAYVFIHAAIYEKTGIIPEVYDNDGNILEVYKFMLDALESDYKSIAYEYRWNIPAYKAIFSDMMKKLLASEDRGLTLKKKLNVMFFMGYVRKDNATTKWLISRLYDLKEQFKTARVKPANGKKGPGKNKKKKRDTTSLYLEGVEYLIDELKKDYSPSDRLDEAKRFLAEGKYSEAENEARKGAEHPFVSGDNEDILSALSIVKDITAAIDSAGSDYASQLFILSRDNYEKALESLKKLDITPGEDLLKDAGKAREMAKAEQAYLKSADSEAMEAAIGVKDQISAEFIKKVKKISAIIPGEEKHKKDMDALKASYPGDRRVAALHGEFVRIYKKNRIRQAEAREKLKQAKVLLKSVSDNSVDELISAVSQVVSLSGITRELRQLISDAAEKYRRGNNNYEALKLLEEVKLVAERTSNEYGENLERLRGKFAEALEKEDLDQKKQRAEKVFAKADKWSSNAGYKIRDLEKILKDMIRVFRSGVYARRCGQYYLKMLNCAYDRGHYREVLSLGGQAKNIFGREIDAELQRMEWKTEAKQLIDRVRNHYNILDCEVKGEALSVKNRRINKYDDRSNILKYDFEKTEYKNAKLRISELFHHAEDSTPKDKKVQVSVLEAIKRNESYMMMTENGQGDKIEIFLNVYARNKDYIEFEIPYEQERNKLREGEELKPGLLVRVSDPSLLRRRNQLARCISAMESCIALKKTPSTGHPLSDIALNAGESPRKSPRKGNISFKDFKIAEDKTQKDTVEACLEPDLPFHLIQGPPGTGKTRITVELIRQFYERGKRVLVVSQSNAGIDNLALRLLELTRKGEAIKFARVGNDEKVIDEALRENWNDRSDMLESMYADRKGSIILGTTNGFPAVISNITNKEMCEYYKKYDVVIVEEAGRATLAETIYPVSWVESDGKVILVGDHKQLPAYGIDEQKRSDILNELVKDGYDKSRIELYLHRKKINDYKISLFEHLWRGSNYFESGVNKHILTVNRRSHWAIAGLVSDLFYGSRIVPDPEHINRALERDTFSVIDYDKGTEKKTNEKITGTSFSNQKEAHIVVEEVDRILSQKGKGRPRYSANDITIITPYEAQKNLIIDLLEVKAIMNDLRDGKLFAGEEADIRNKLEKLEVFILEDPQGYDTEGFRAIGRIKWGKTKHVEEEIKKIDQALRFNPLLSGDSGGIFTYEDFSRIKIDNIDSVQGSENKVVILSLVRSNINGDMGFLGTKDGMQRLNVSYSRAQEKFIVIGDFANTLCDGDPKKNFAARNIFKKTVQAYEELYADKETISNDIGAEGADNTTVVNPIIADALRNKKAVKLTFDRGAYFYYPSFLPGYPAENDDTGERAEPLLNNDQIEKLKVYLENAIGKHGSDNESLELKDITVGIIKDRTYINPSSDNRFSLVHAGVSTATIWFGELFLREMLDKHYDEDMKDLIEHEISHIADTSAASAEHKDEMFGGLKYRLDSRAEKTRAENETRRMLDSLSLNAHKIKENKKLIIGLDLSWMRDAQSIRILLSQLKRLNGKDNIEIKVGRAPALALEIADEIEDNDFSNVIILGSAGTIDSPEFQGMKNVPYEKRAFFAGIDPRELEKELSPGEYNYIRVVEMINISLVLAFKDSRTLLDIRQSYPGIVIEETINPRVFVFIPKAKPLHLKELNEIYKAQAKIIFSA